MKFATLFAATALVQGSFAAYNLVEDFSGGGFFDHFDFFTADDPTHGFVNYVDRAAAEAQGLINTNNGVAYMAADSANVASGRGRNSVRVTSKTAFTHGLVTIQLNHMPNSQCGSWPAFWTVGNDWPNNGEIDIIEGVNNQGPNFMTLHTSANCAVTNAGSGLLQPYSQNCDAAVNGNEGCAFHENNAGSYGNGLNAAGGAVYAMEWTSAGISIWWWGGSNPAPADVLGNNPNPGGWGPPSANFAGTGCVWDDKFRNQQIVFDLTFCGDWAGSVFEGMCPGQGSCVDYVANHPGDFKEAYWSIPALKLYANAGKLAERDFENEIHNSTQTETVVKRCQDQGLCLRDPEPEPAAASQIAPQKVPKASQTVDADAAIQRAQAGVKRAAASQVAPQKVPKASQTVDAELAKSRAKAGSNGRRRRTAGAQ